MLRIQRPAALLSIPILPLLYLLLPAGRCSSGLCGLTNTCYSVSFGEKETFQSSAINIVALEPPNRLQNADHSWHVERPGGERVFITSSRTVAGVAINVNCQSAFRSLFSLEAPSPPAGEDGALNCGFSSPAFPTRLSFIDCFNICHVLVRSLLEILLLSRMVGTGSPTTSRMLPERSYERVARRSGEVRRLENVAFYIEVFR